MSLKIKEVEEINTLLQTLKDAHWLHSSIHYETNFSQWKNEKAKHEALKKFIEKLVVEIFNKIDTIK